MTSPFQSPHQNNPLPVITGALAILYAGVQSFSIAREMLLVIQLGHADFIWAAIAYNAFSWLTAILGFLGGILLIQRKSVGWMILASLRVSFAIGWIYLFLTVGNPMDGVDPPFWTMLLYAGILSLGTLLAILVFLPGTMHMIDQKAIWILISILAGAFYYGLTRLVQYIAMSFF